MDWKTYHLEFITPCFCAGANQAKAEIRPASIRGLLRWWFRALGGSKAEEAEIFGAASGDTGKASALCLRVGNIVRSNEDWRGEPNDGGEFSNMRCQDGNIPPQGAYIWYFATVSAKNTRWFKGGDRNAHNPKGCCNPGTTFDLHIAFRRPISDALQQKFDDALNAALLLGGIGMRLTRGMGAWFTSDLPTSVSDLSAFIQQTLQPAGFAAVPLPQRWDNWPQAVYWAERWLREHFRKNGMHEHGYHGNSSSPLGCANPRQTSAIYLRPVWYGTEQKYGLIFFEAPHGRTLGRKTPKSEPFLAKFDFSNETPRELSKLVLNRNQRGHDRGHNQRGGGRGRR